MELAPETFPDAIEAVIRQFYNVEFVYHNLGSRQYPSGGIPIGYPHVHAYKSDPVAVRDVMEEMIDMLFIPAWQHIVDTSLSNIGQDTARFPKKVYLVYPQNRRR